MVIILVTVIEAVNIDLIKNNRHTIEALDKAGYSILPAEKVCDGSVDMKSYDKFIVDFAASELPRGGGGARCMTMPLARE